MITKRHTRIGATAIAAASLLLAACGSSSSTSSSAAASGTTGGSSGGPTVATAAVPGVGTVLVNGSGQTLYVLSIEAGGKITCTDASGCTKFWPDNELPSGVTSATAGTGIQSSMLGTVKEPSTGKLYVTYAGYPLYTFIMDSGPGTAKGEGVKSFGGTWTAMSPDGTPVAPASPAGTSGTTGSSSTTGTSGTTGSSTTSTTSSSSGSGYGSNSGY